MSKRKTAKQKAAEAAASKRWRERNLERARAIGRENYRKNLPDPSTYRSRAERKLSEEERKRRGRERTARWKAKNVEQDRERYREYYSRNADKIRARAAKWYHDNRIRTLARRYGLTQEQYDALGTTCAICGATEANGNGYNLHIDHDHDSGKVRGLLCRGCNIGIGNLKHDIGLLQKAIAYLQRT